MQVFDRDFVRKNGKILQHERTFITTNLRDDVSEHFWLLLPIRRYILQQINESPQNGKDLMGGEKA
jgi:hypothetical protein